MINVLNETNNLADVDEIIVPLAAETLRIDTQEVVTGGVRISKVVKERQEIVDEALIRRNVDIMRVPVDQFVDVAPEVRQEGDTLIVPVLEEVLVVTRRLRLKEEIHITQRSSEYHAPQTVTLWSEEAQIERWTAENEKPSILPVDA